MPTDLDRRMRAAVEAPDTEAALTDVLHRIRRRTRRRTTTVAIAAVVAVAGLVVGSGVGRDADDAAPLLAGEPPGQLVLRPQWTSEPLGPGDVTTVGAGRFLVAAGDTVLGASGGRVTALHRDTDGVRWTFELDEPVFIQGASGGVAVVSAKHDRVLGLDLADGTVVWELSLAALGLNRYGAVTSAVTEPVSAIGVSANTEGDVREPVVLGIETATGTVAWQTPLAVGTDLTWGTPVPHGGLVAFHSTLSHPESAEGNAVHVVDLAGGEVEATFGLGGSQGFTSDPVILDGDLVHVPAWPDVRTFPLTGDRTERRSLPGRAAVLVGTRLWVLAPDDRLVAVDASSGDPLVDVPVPVADPQRLLALGADLLAVSSATDIAIVDGTGSRVLRRSWPVPVVEVVAAEPGALLTLTLDRTIAAYTVEPADPEAACQPLTGDEPVVESYAITDVPDGYALDGPVEHTTTGDSDAGGESEWVQRLVAEDGSEIEVVEFGSDDPSAFIAAAHGGIAPRRQTITRCIDHPDGPRLVEQSAEVSDGVVSIGEWEYGGILVRGAGAPIGELVQVIAGLRRYR